MGKPLESLTKLPRPFGPFTLIRLIAQGGMGQVFLALRPVEGEPTDEVCVVKTVRTDLREDREAIGRFLDEARIIQLLDHPNICHTLDAGVFDRTYFLGLEFISGRNFRDIQQRALKLGRQLADEVIFHGIVQMLEALSYAHTFRDASTGASLGVVHRDVSPHNLMLGFDGYVKLIDFGLAAHTLKRELTRPGIMVGKLRYNAPEQVRDRALDGRSDLYSAGVMLYELLVGERFYEGLSEEEIWRVAMKGTFRPRGFAGLPRAVRNVLELAIAPEPEERYPSAEHMKDAVTELGRSRGVSEGRRAAARFMGELFAEERRAERDMILQATGLAEARTRLFEAPIISDEPSMSRSASSLGRSHVVSPAQVRGRLAELLSEEFDPEAQTMLPQVPAFSSDDSDESVSGRQDSPFSRGSQGHTDIGGGKLSRSDRANDADTVVQPPGDSVDRAVKRAAAAPTRPILDENLRIGRGGTAPAAPGLAATRPAVTPRVTGEMRPHEPRTLPSVRPARTLLVGLGALAALLIVVVVVVALASAEQEDAAVRVVTVAAPPQPEAPSEPSSPLANSDHEPSTPTASPDEPQITNPPPDPAATAATEATEATEATVDDSGPAKTTAAKADKLKVTSAERERLAREKVERARLAREKAERERMARERVEHERTRPPQRELKTLKEQLGYLKEFCLQRVACASPSVEDAKKLATLSPEQTKELLNEVNRCIKKCQR